jgi:hypothetical protein
VNMDGQNSQSSAYRPERLPAPRNIVTPLLRRRKNVNEGIYLQPGDMLFVPQSTISKIRKYIPNTGMGAYYNPAVF